MDKNIKKTAVENFLGTLDLELPIQEHFANALRDAQLYNWDSSVVVEIFEGIEDAYKKKEK